MSVLRKFLQKFQDFFNIVIFKGQGLGKVAHYFYKEEYQARGAPHYHVILWIDSAPVAGKDVCVLQPYLSKNCIIRFIANF